jgi:hypothetical protein
MPLGRPNADAPSADRHSKPFQFLHPRVRPYKQARCGKTSLESRMQLVEIKQPPKVSSLSQLPRVHSDWQESGLRQQNTRPACPERMKAKWQLKKQECARTYPACATQPRDRNTAEKPAARQEACKWSSHVDVAIPAARLRSGNSQYEVRLNYPAKASISHARPPGDCRGQSKEENRT